MNNDRFKKGQRPSIKTEFKKGIVPHNKGVFTSPIKKCTVCAIEFRGRGIKFCSLQCSGVVHKDRKVSVGTREKMSVAKKGKVSPHLGKKRPEFAGENNWNWVADRTLLKKQEERNGNRHKEWSRSIKNRDGWKCKISNSDCSGQVVAHHILPWRDYVDLRYEVNNGISLCHFHHPRKRNDEMRLSPYFQELVNSK